MVHVVAELHFVFFEPLFDQVLHFDLDVWAVYRVFALVSNQVKHVQFPKVGLVKT